MSKSRRFVKADEPEASLVDHIAKRRADQLFRKARNKTGMILFERVEMPTFREILAGAKPKRF